MYHRVEWCPSSIGGNEWSIAKDIDKSLIAEKIVSDLVFLTVQEDWTIKIGSFVDDHTLPADHLCFAIRGFAARQASTRWSCSECSCRRQVSAWYSDYIVVSRESFTSCLAAFPDSPIPGELTSECGPDFS